MVTGIIDYRHLKNNVTQDRLSTFLGPSKAIQTGRDSVILLLSRIERGAFSQDLYGVAGVTFPNTLDKAVEKRRADYLAGRMLALRALAHFGCQPAHLPIGPDRAPVWPRGINGTISHTQNWCAVILTNQPGLFVGVDVEANLDMSSMESVSKIVLDQDEDDVILGSNIPRAIALAAAFSGKETLFKGLYPLVGEFFGFEAARLKTISETKGIEFILTCDLANELPNGQTHSVNLMSFAQHVLTWHIFQPNSPDPLHKTADRLSPIRPRSSRT